jgi:hypothetical protein
MIRLPLSLVVASLFGVSLLTGCNDGVARSAVKVNVTSSKVKLEETDSISIGFTPNGSGELASASGNPKSMPFTATSSAKDAPGVAPG